MLFESNNAVNYKISEMTFFQFEIDYLKKSFPFEKAYLTEDLDEKELQTVDELGILKHAPHLYLGYFFPYKNTDYNF